MMMMMIKLLLVLVVVAAAAAAEKKEEREVTGPLKILFVVSHPNVGKSFSHVLVQGAKEALEADGHQVQVSDLVAQGFQAHGNAHDFKNVQNSDSFDYQMEQKHAATTQNPEEEGFADDVRREMDRLEWSDVVIHQFPMYWWSLPAIHKGWLDRVLAYYWCYGGGSSVRRLKGKGWMMAVTTGAPADMQLRGGWPTPANDDVPSMLQNHNTATPGMLGMLSLPMFIASEPGRRTAKERAAMVQEYVAHLRAYVTGSVDQEDIPEPALTLTVPPPVRRAVEQCWIER